MKKYWYIVVIFMLLCSCEKDATEVVLQEVKGARDCVKDSQGSWSDGVVTLDYGENEFGFVVKSNGILKFEHRKIRVTSVQGSDKAEVYVLSRLLSRELISTKSNYGWKECNVGLVEAGDMITIGRDNDYVVCKVKNVRIVCQDCMVDDF